MPQESTGYSPFELLYGREVRGPLDVIKECWESPNPIDESVLSHVLSMRKKFKEMQELVQFNLVKAQNYQNKWYDRNARQSQFIPGEFVLVLLPTTTSKFIAQWQGSTLRLALGLSLARTNP